mmetsp:Transcript_27888/g.59267  ORF Transcript_27888/g.59267 Transcript_27888/m.59267 type:complete len:522 (-) Transcript_27888:2-1567(-)
MTSILISVETIDGKTQESMPGESLLPRIMDSSTTSASASTPAIAALKCMWEGKQKQGKKKKRTNVGGAVSSCLWTPTAIQLQSWSVLLNENESESDANTDNSNNGGNKNLIAIAPTGSGKTLAYGMGILAMVATPKSKKKKGICAICLVPTRELAIQVQKNLRPHAKDAQIRIACIYGGQGGQADRDEQISSLKRPNVFVVSTPGRLVDLLEDRSDLRKLCKSVQFLVLDEADMLARSKDSCDQIESIRQHLPGNIRTCLFSATQFKSVTRKWDGWVRKPRVVIVNDNSNEAGTTMAGSDNEGEVANNSNMDDNQPTSKKRRADGGDRGAEKEGGFHQTIPPNVSQTIRMCNCTEDKSKHLLSTIATIRQTQAKRNPGLTIVFVAHIKTLQAILKVLVKSNVMGCDQYHGQMKQAERERALTNFRSGKSTILLATDIAARGMHIKNLEYVINYDFPDSVEQYVHRCGRVGRMQKDGSRANGTVFSFCTKKEIAHELARWVVGLLQSTKSWVDPKLLDFVCS